MLVSTSWSLEKRVAAVKERAVIFGAAWFFRGSRLWPVEGVKGEAEDADCFPERER